MLEFPYFLSIPPWFMDRNHTIVQLNTRVISNMAKKQQKNVVKLVPNSQLILTGPGSCHLPFQLQIQGNWYLSKIHAFQQEVENFQVHPPGTELKLLSLSSKQQHLSQVGMFYYPFQGTNISMQTYISPLKLACWEDEFPFRIGGTCIRSLPRLLDGTLGGTRVTWCKSWWVEWKAAN